MARTVIGFWTLSDRIVLVFRLTNLIIFINCLIYHFVGKWIIYKMFLKQLALPAAYGSESFT
jgi:hypothetical protein